MTVWCMLCLVDVGFFFVRPTLKSHLVFVFECEFRGLTARTRIIIEEFLRRPSSACSPWRVFLVGPVPKGEAQESRVRLDTRSHVWIVVRYIVIDYNQEMDLRQINPKQTRQRDTAAKQETHKKRSPHLQSNELGNTNSWFTS